MTLPSDFLSMTLALILVGSFPFWLMRGITSFRIASRFSSCLVAGGDWISLDVTTLNQQYSLSSWFIMLRLIFMCVYTVIYSNQELVRVSRVKTLSQVCYMAVWCQQSQSSTAKVVHILFFFILFHVFQSKTRRSNFIQISQLILPITRQVDTLEAIRREDFSKWKISSFVSACSTQKWNNTVPPKTANPVRRESATFPTRPDLKNSPYNTTYSIRLNQHHGHRHHHEPYDPMKLLVRV